MNANKPTNGIVMHCLNGSNAVAISYSTTIGPNQITYLNMAGHYSCAETCGMKHTIFSSFGTNSQFGNYLGPASAENYYNDRLFGKKAKDVPVFMDSAQSMIYFNQYDCDPPPEPDYLGRWNSTRNACIDRHNGGINSLFGDLSSRKVGLKELWTLKWYPSFKINNKWTRAGGVHPDDWPKWMHKYKEY